MNDTDFVKLAIQKSKESVEAGGFPAGAVVVKNGEVVGSGISIGNVLHDPTSHGEIAAIRDACKNLKTLDLSECVLYSSLKPCLMCSSAAFWAGISKIVFACRKNQVSQEYYESSQHGTPIRQSFHRPIECVHVSEMEEEAIKIIRGWETKDSSFNISSRYGRRLD